MTSMPDKTASGPPPPRQLRFVNNQGQPPSKRRRINAACLTCRRRKTRCDGERPLCSTCTKNGHQCQGYPEESRKDANGDAFDTKQPTEDYDGIPLDDIQTEEDELKPGLPKIDVTPAPEPATTHSTGHEVKKYHSTSPHRKSTSRHATPGVERIRANIDTANTRVSPANHASHPSASTDDTPSSPTVHRYHSHRVPYFRYFGPTAIVPGFKQMVVSVRNRRRSTGGSLPVSSPLSSQSGGLRRSSIAEGSDVAVEDMPVYDPTSPLPVHPLILGLIQTFFDKLGCNYPFLKRAKFIRMVLEKRVETILVDSVCAIAARFSDAQQVSGGNVKMPRTERGHIFAQRAKLATVETFPCPSVGAVQALLLMAYEGFGADQDSALWMYLGLAIRMAVDLGLQKRIGIQYQGDKDPWYTAQKTRDSGGSESPEERRSNDPDALSVEEQKEVEQERTDTFWAVFFLDRVISSGTGRPVTFRDDDFELPFPARAVDPATGWPTLFPILLEIIHLYGRVSDVLNKIHEARDLNDEEWSRLAKLEHQLTRMYRNWDNRLQFNVSNFKAYLNIGQGTTFILLHLWFHALFIILHQPKLLTPAGDYQNEQLLLSDSRELSMSSAKTICDILSFADLIDPISFIGNPFTSQPIYIAACAFLMESSANASEGPSRENSPPIRDRKSVDATKLAISKHSRHSLLASAANQNYQRCYNSLQQMHEYWGGIKYILTALDQKAKGIWDCETYTTEEYESTKMPPIQAEAVTDFSHLTTSSPKAAGPPIAWTLAGTANSPSSNLTLMYQNLTGQAVNSTPLQQSLGAQHQANTPSGSGLYDPNRQSLPTEHGGMYPPALPPSTVHGSGSSPQRSRARRKSALSMGHGQSVTPNDTGSNMAGAGIDEPRAFVPSGFTPASQTSGGTYDGYNASPTSNLPDGNSHGHSGGTPTNHAYYAHGLPYQSSWAFGSGNMDAITFDSQDIDIGALGLQPDFMGGWLEYVPNANDVLGLFENHNLNNGPVGPGGKI